MEGWIYVESLIVILMQYNMYFPSFAKLARRALCGLVLMWLNMAFVLLRKLYLTMHTLNASEEYCLYIHKKTWTFSSRLHEQADRVARSHVRCPHRSRSENPPSNIYIAYCSHKHEAYSQLPAQQSRIYDVMNAFNAFGLASVDERQTTTWP